MRHAGLSGWRGAGSAQGCEFGENSEHLVSKNSRFQSGPHIRSTCTGAWECTSCLKILRTAWIVGPTSPRASQRYRRRRRSCLVFPSLWSSKFICHTRCTESAVCCRAIIEIFRARVTRPALKRCASRQLARARLSVSALRRTCIPTTSSWAPLGASMSGAPEDIEAPSAMEMTR